MKMTRSFYIVQINFLQDKTMTNARVANHRIIPGKRHDHANSGGKCRVSNYAGRVYPNTVQCIEEKITERVFPNLADKPSGHPQPRDVVCKYGRSAAEGELHIVGVFQFVECWQRWQACENQI